MSDDSETIAGDSDVGKRLAGLHRSDEYQVSCGGKRFPIVAEIAIGRGSENQIVLADSLVSREHAVIQKIKNEYFIKDRYSSNGTFVNGRKVPRGKYVKLGAEDIVVVGRTELKLVSL